MNHKYTKHRAADILRTATSAQTWTTFQLQHALAIHGHELTYEEVETVIADLLKEGSLRKALPDRSTYYWVDEPAPTEEFELQYRLSFYRNPPNYDERLEDYKVYQLVHEKATEIANEWIRWSTHSSPSTPSFQPPIAPLWDQARCAAKVNLLKKGYLIRTDYGLKVVG